VIEDVVSLVLHNNVPGADVDNVEVPLQLFTTVTTGAGGVAGWSFTVTVLATETQPSLLRAVMLYEPASTLVKIPSA
jgi:hypothetical protein